MWHDIFETYEVFCRRRHTHITYMIFKFILRELSFNDGITALINCDWMCPYKEHKFSVIGTKGSLIFDDTKTWSEKLLYNPSFVTSKNSIITAPIEKINTADTPAPYSPVLLKEWLPNSEDVIKAVKKVLYK